MKDNCTHGDAGPGLRDRIRAAVDERWTGPVSLQVVEDDLPGIAESVKRKFAAMDVDDARNQVFVNANDPRLFSADCPYCWLWKNSYYRLRDMVEGRTGKVLERLRQERLSFISPGADAFLVEDAAPVSDCRVWGELERLLLRSQWPADVAAQVVSTIADTVDFSKGVPTGKPLVSGKSMEKGLGFLNPPARREALVRFVYAKEGFMWSLAQGMDPRRALAQTNPEDLLDIIWKPATVAVSTGALRPVRLAEQRTG